MNTKGPLIKQKFVIMTLLFLGASINVLAANTNTTANNNNLSNLNPGNTAKIRADYGKRFPVAKENFPTTMGGMDVVENGSSSGPGQVIHGPGPVYTWPVLMMAPVESQVPSARDMSITKNLLNTDGYMLTDTQFQIISRENSQRFIEELYDPERWMWLPPALGTVGLSAMVNSVNAMNYQQTANAITFAQTYLTNFTIDSSNRWAALRNNLFVPMALLIILPGAILSQIRATMSTSIAAVGTNINPFDGILRSIIAIFMIPGTYLVMNYGIDISNTLSYSLSSGYQLIFHRSMYSDALAIQQLSNAQAPSSNTMSNTGTTTSQSGTAVRNPTSNAHFDQVGALLGTAALTFSATWNILCGFQVAYLRFLWCTGPIVAAFWVWPKRELQGALPSWISGVITLCLWNFFWNTLIMVAALVVDNNQAINDYKRNPQYITAISLSINFLANVIVTSAFAFSNILSSVVYLLSKNMSIAPGMNPQSALTGKTNN